MRKIPEQFLEDMRQLLGDSYEVFCHAMLSGEPYKGLRVNTTKISCGQFEKISPFPLQKSPLCQEGYLIESDTQAGSHPYHHAGLYYLQEPSAWSVTEVLAPKPGMRILDLCAAPGGKSGHIASRLAGTGILVSNECVASRARVLRSNLERLGIRNACVTCAMPERLAKCFSNYFDAVVVDAPCSGEGMFRKDLSACESWSREHVKSCALRQANILESAVKTVCGGGILVYSTCTLNPIEDEAVVDQFLKKHREFEIERIDTISLPAAHPEWCGADARIAFAVKLMPHEIEGEGHFVARLRRIDGEHTQSFQAQQQSAVRALTKEEMHTLQSFWEEQFTCPMWQEPMIWGEMVYFPSIQPDLPILCTGTPVGMFRGKRFEPEHGLYMAIAAEHCRNRRVFSPEDEWVAAYLAGNEMAWDGETGYAVVCVGEKSFSVPLGFGKASGGRLKNKYPKGLRVLNKL